MNPRNIVAVVFAALAGVSLLYLGMSSRPPEPEKVFTAAELPPAWKPEVLDAFELMPLADNDGRVKSMHTFAYFELLRTRAYATLSLKVEGEKQKRSWTPAAWLLDCFFYPQFANNYPSFVVEDGEVLAQLGLSPHEKQRDRYTFNELRPAREAIVAASQRLGMKAQDKPEEMTRVESLTLALARNFASYESLTTLFDSAREKIAFPAEVDDETLKQFAGKEVPALQAFALVISSPAWQNIENQQTAAEPATPPEWLKTMAEQFKSKLKPVRDLYWYPPTAKGMDNWLGSTGLTNDLGKGGPHASGAVARLTELSELATLATDLKQNDVFQDKLLAFATARTNEAKAVDAYGKVAQDRAYLKWRVFEYVKWFFVLLFLFTAVSWLMPRALRYQKVLRGCAWVGFAALLGGILQRVFITGWGPVTNIYETIPYITLMAGVFSLLMSRVMKNALPLSVAVAIGAGGMFLASMHEAGKSEDTIDALQAVLRSNYWLWTHVTSINLGYATVLLAAIFSMVYIFARVFDLMRKETKLFTDLTRSAYGILCFGLFFGLIGTILGGIWGNESWGRFWGWDPKENGALLIVLWCLMVLHMRLAGWIREFGFHIWTAMGAIPTIFSWWHVNLLNVGLHSYGFTEGLETYLRIAYGIVAGIVILGIVLRFLEGVARRQMAAAKQALPAGSADPA